MKEVALVTCYFKHNYGSMLQAYATQQILDNWEIPNVTICTDGFAKEIKYAKVKYFINNISFDIIKDKWGLVKLLIAEKIFLCTFGKNMRIRRKKFNSFSKKHFRLSEKYLSIEDLGKSAENYSAFLVGSDQLWLPSNIAANYYTLSFVPKKIRKIAYATSFGVSVLSPKIQQLAATFLSRIDYLSVREITGQKLVKNITGRDAAVVCDPTLLLTAEEWLLLLKKEPFIKGNYIFCYFLGNNPYSRAFARQLKRITGLKIVALQQLDSYIRSDKYFADEVPYDVDPGDFINLILNAAYICTDSFHGTVFSIIYHKEFFVFRRYQKRSPISTNSRIDSLVDILGVRSRLIEDRKISEVGVDTVIDYYQVEEKLSLMRIISREFLDQSFINLWV